MVDPNQSQSIAQSTQHQVNHEFVDPNDPADFARKHLSDDDKFKLLTLNIEIPGKFKFPLTLGTRFNPTWIASRPFLRYCIKK